MDNSLFAFDSVDFDGFSVSRDGDFSRVSFVFDDLVTPLEYQGCVFAFYLFKTSFLVWTPGVEVPDCIRDRVISICGFFDSVRELRSHYGMSFRSIRDLLSLTLCFSDVYLGMIYE